MRPLTIIGAILVVVGLVALAVGVIPIHHQEEVAKIGSLTATTDKENHIFIPPYASIAAIVVGALMIYIGAMAHKRA